MIKFNKTKNKHNKIVPFSMDRGQPLTDNLDKSISTIRNGSFIHINGPSESGKTTVMLNLIVKKNMKGKPKTSLIGCFNQIYLVSPSLHTIKGDPFAEVEDEFRAKRLSISFLEKMYEDIYEQLEKYNEEEDPVKKKKMKKFNLLILDDVSTTINSNKSLENFFNTMVAERAHINLTIIIITQNYKMCPKKARENCTHFFTKKVQGLDDQEAIFEDYFSQFPRKARRHIFPIFFEKPDDVLYVDKSRKVDSIDYYYYQNFDRVELEEN